MENNEKDNHFIFAVMTFLCLTIAIIAIFCGEEIMQRINIFGRIVMVGIPAVVLVILFIFPAAFIKEKTIEDYLAEAKEIFITADSTKIDAEYFSRHKNVKSIIFQDSITQIDSKTLLGCSELEYVELPANLTKIESYTFSSCNKLKTVVLSKNLNKISEKAFYGCSSLELIKFKCKKDEVELNLEDYATWGISASCNVRFEDSYKDKTFARIANEKKEKQEKKENATAATK